MILLIISTCASRVFIIVQAIDVILSVHIRSAHRSFIDGCIVPYVNARIHECIRGIGNGTVGDVVFVVVGNLGWDGVAVRFAEGLA